MAAERVRLPQQPLKNSQTAPTNTYGRSIQQASAELTPLALPSVSCEFKVNSLEPRQLEPNGYGKQELVEHAVHLVGAEVGHSLAHWLRVQRQVCAISALPGHELRGDWQVCTCW